MIKTLLHQNCALRPNFGPSVDLVCMMQTVPLSVIDAAIVIWLGLSQIPLIRANGCTIETIVEFAEWLLCRGHAQSSTLAGMPETLNKLGL